MLVLIDTSSAELNLTLVDDDGKHEYKWQTGRNMARDLFSYIEQALADRDAKLADITGLGVMKGPGSFTGLRIGIAVFNTLANELEVPIIGVSWSEDWKQNAIDKLKSGLNDRVVLPEYGASPNITKPKK